MTRLTAERESEIRGWFCNSKSQRSVAQIARELLAELDALRAENEELLQGKK